MPIEALLLCKDDEVLRTVRRTLDDLGIQVLVSASPAYAAQTLTRRKFDALIADCDDLPGASDVLRHLRQGAPNRAAIVFAIVNHGTSVSAAFEMGANFVLDKPLQLEFVTRSFRAAHGLIVRERRRYFRQEIKIPVTLHLNGTHVKAEITNLSEGGIAVCSVHQLPDARTVRATFTLPNGRQIDGRGEVVWNSGQRAGIRLPFITGRMRSHLADWLNLASQAQEPVHVFVNASRGRLDA